MSVTVTTDVPEIIGRIEPALIADPVRHTVLASVRDQLRLTGEDGWCAYNATALAARSSSATPVALTERWTDVPALAAALDALPSLAGVGGPVAAVQALVETLHRRPSRVMRERLYQLDSLTSLRVPRGVPGTARRATAAHLRLVAGWVEPFMRETFGALPPDFDARRWTANAIERSAVWLWFDPAGTPVSFAARRAPAAGVARIGPVYTPPEHRGRGFGSAATARAAFDVLDSAAVPVLYTDLENPTSNKIYRAIGFRPVTDRLSLSFS